MKTPPLLFSLPLLLTTLAVQSLAADTSTAEKNTQKSTAATTREPATQPAATTTEPVRPLMGPGGVEMWPTSEGMMMRLPLRGRTRLMHVMTNQFHVQERDGNQKVMRLTGTEDLEGITREISRNELTTGMQGDLVAYHPDHPRTDAAKVLITRRIVVRLEEGMSFSAFANDSGASSAMRPGYAPECLILGFASGMDAIGKAAELSRKPGVVNVEHIISVRRTPDFIPTATYFAGGGPSYSPPPMTDNVLGWQCPPWLCNIIPTSAYQWWANNRVNPPGTAPRNSVAIARVDLGDYPPIEYDPDLPAVHGEQSDIRLPVVWEHPGTITPRLNGFLVKVLIIDDGLQKTHPDLSPNAVDTVATHHKNYTTQPFDFPITTTNPIPYSNNANPDNSAFDTHGTSVAGIVGARESLTSRMVGVAPKCTLQGAVAVKGFVSDDGWSDAFALGSTIQDSQPQNNSLLDETRSGLMDFKVCLNAVVPFADQDAVNLYYESWLWTRAIRHGATKGNLNKGISYVTSAGNGGDGHMDANYLELKNCIYQIPVAGVSDLGRRIASSNKGSPIVCAAPTWGNELPPLLNWSSSPQPIFGSRPIKVNPPVEVDNLPYPLRRITQGIPTLSTTNHVQTPNYDFNFGGTSASAAQVAGIVALMMEANPNLGGRDVKEILMRSSRVCNDARVTWNGLLWDTQWRMSRTGNPMHYAFGAGLVDANLAVQIAKKWPGLPFNPFVPRQIADVTDPDLWNFIGTRISETGGIYLQTGARQLIPLNLTGTDAPVEIMLPPPPGGMRLEHIEVRVRLYHQRRGDLEIKLIAPGELGWEQTGGNIYLNGQVLKPGDPGWQPGRPMESDLYVPHREDYTESRWDQNVVELRDPTDWTFTTVRHWGTRIPTGNAGTWKLRIRDAVSRGANPVASYDDPVVVPSTKPNPTNPQSQRLEDVAITYHGVFEKRPGVEPPEVASRATKFRFGPNMNPTQAQLFPGPLDTDNEGAVRYPVTNWDFFNSVDIAPMQPSNPPREFFEFFPPLLRDPLDPNILIPLDDPATPIDEWPNRPLGPTWVPWIVDTEPVTGPQGGLTSQPAWGPVVNGQRTPMEMTPDNQYMVLHEIDRKTGLEKPNVIHMRLNRATGLIDIVPLELGIYRIQAYVENILGMSRPRMLEITISLPQYANWKALFWDAPEVNDESISGFYADPDGDRLANGLEFAMRTNPTEPQPADDPIPAWRIEGNEIVFTYPEDATVEGVKLRAQVSEDLTVWSDVNPPPTMVSESNGLRVMEVRLSLVDDKAFFRLWAQNLTNPNDPPVTP